MRKLGDKIGAKLIAEEVGVPVAPWSRGAVDDLGDAAARGGEIGYPLMLKATAGGGGRGIRVITSEAELADAYERTSQEAAAGVRQRRGVPGAPGHRRPARRGPGDRRRPGHRVGARRARLLGAAAQPEGHRGVRVAGAEPRAGGRAQGVGRAAGRRGRTTAARRPSSSSTTPATGCSRSWRSTPACRSSTRSPSPPPASTWSRLQLHVAAGGRLDGEPPAERGHAVEARLNAEDPDRDFAPSPGRIARLDLPAGPGIRVDTGVSEGDTIPADFDSMIAKIIAYGRDRDEALGRLRRAMAETTVIIEGGATNKSFVLDLLDQPEVIDASADTGWIDRVRGEGRLVSHRHSAVALAAAAHRGVRGGGTGRAAAAAVHGVRRPPAGAARERPAAGPQAARRRLPRPGRAGRRAPLPGRHRRRQRHRRAHRGRRARPVRPAHRPDQRQRHAVPPGHRHARADPPGRGGRCHAPGQPRRGRRGALARRPRWWSRPRSRSAPRSRRARRCWCWRA